MIIHVLLNLWRLEDSNQILSFLSWAHANQSVTLTQFFGRLMLKAPPDVTSVENPQLG